MGLCQVENFDINFITRENTFRPASIENTNSSIINNSNYNSINNTNRKLSSIDNVQFNNTKINPKSKYKFKMIPSKTINLFQNNEKIVYNNKINSNPNYNSPKGNKYLLNIKKQNSLNKENNQKMYSFRSEKIPVDNLRAKLSISMNNNEKSINENQINKNIRNKSSTNKHKRLDSNTFKSPKIKSPNINEDKIKKIKIIKDEDDTDKIISHLNDYIKKKNNNKKINNSLILSFDDEENKDEDIQLYYLNEFNFNPENKFSSEKDFDGIIQSKIFKNKINFTNLLLLLPERRWYKELIELSDTLKKNRQNKTLDSLFFNEYLNRIIKIYNHFNHLVWALGYFYSNSLLFNKSVWFKKDKINLPSKNSLEWIKGFEWKGLHIRVLTYEKSKKLFHEIKALKYSLLDYIELLNNECNNKNLNKDNNCNNLLSNDIIFPFMSYSYIGGIILYVSVEIKKLFYEENNFNSNLSLKDESRLRKSLIRQSLQFSIKFDNYDYNPEDIDNISFDENILNEEINLSNYSKNDLNSTKILHNIAEKNLLKIFGDYNDKNKERKFKFIIINMYSLLPDLFKEDDKTIYHKLNQLNCIDIKNEFDAPRYINLTKINNLDKNNEMAIISKLIRINATKENIDVYQNRIDNIDYKIIYDNNEKGNKINDQITKFFVQFPLIQNSELTRLLTTEYLNVGNLNYILNKYNIENTQEIPDRNIIIFRTTFKTKMKYSIMSNNKIQLFPQSNEEYISYFKEVCKEMSENSYKIRNIDNLNDFCERFGINKRFLPFCIELIDDENLKNLIQIYLYISFIKKFYNYHEGQTIVMKLAIYERCKDESIINSSESIKDNNIIELQKQFIVDIIKLIFNPVESLKESNSKDPFCKLFFQNITFFIFLKMLKIKNLEKYINFQSTLSQLDIKQILIIFNDISRNNPFLFIDTLEKMINIRINPFIKYRASIDTNNLKSLKKDDVIIFSPKTKSFIDIPSITSYIFTNYADNTPPINEKNNLILSKINLDNFYPNLMFKNPIIYDTNNKLSFKSNHYYIYGEEKMKKFCRILEEILDGIISHNGDKELILFKSYLYLILNSIFCNNNLNEAKDILNKMKAHLKYQYLFSFTQYSVLYLLEAIISIDDLSYSEELYSKSLFLSLLNQGDIRSQECKIHQFLLFPLFKLSKIESNYNNQYLSEYFNELNFIINNKISKQIEYDNKNKKLNLGYYNFPYDLSILSPSVGREEKDFMNDIDFKNFICNVIIDYFYSIDNLLFDDDYLSYNNINIKDEKDNNKPIEKVSLFNTYKNINIKNTENYNNFNKYISEYLLDEMSYQKSAPSNIIISFGNNNYFQTAQDHPENIMIPRIIYSLLNKKIKKIFSGKEYNFVIDENNKIYSWGLNSDGQCGIPNIEVIQNPTEIFISELEKDEKINNITCGNNITYFLSNKNKVYLCGYNILSKEKYYSPKRVKFFFEKEIIVQIEIGENFCLFLTKWGNVYSFGDGEKGQLGNKEKIINNSEEPKDRGKDIKREPKQVMNIRNIQLISCGNRHCFALSKNNIVFCWGANERGQLGLKNNENNNSFSENNIYIPRKLVLNNEIDNIFCGKDFTVFLTEKKEILVCGNNEEGQLGIRKKLNLQFKKNNNFVKPTQVEQFYHLEINKVVCGENYCVAMVRDSTTKILNIWSWGSNKEGQLGLGSKIENSMPKPIPNLLEYINHIPKDISCGKNHCLVLLERKDEMSINDKKIIDDLIIKYDKF